MGVSFILSLDNFKRYLLQDDIVTVAEVADNHVFGRVRRHPRSQLVGAEAPDGRAFIKVEGQPEGTGEAVVNRHLVHRLLILNRGVEWDVGVHGRRPF